MRWMSEGCIDPTGCSKTALPSRRRPCIFPFCPGRKGRVRDMCNEHMNMNQGREEGEEGEQAAFLHHPCSHPRIRILVILHVHTTSYTDLCQGYRDATSRCVWSRHAFRTCAPTMVQSSGRNIRKKG